MKRLLFVCLVALAYPLTDGTAQITGCDSDPSCRGNMLSIDVTSGRQAEFVDIDNRTAIRNLRYGFSFEAWLLPQEQPNKLQYVAGRWGPNDDFNDQWVIYIQNNTITFELNHPDFNLDRTDNTVASVTLPDLYTRGWFHLTTTWDSASKSARIYIDGIKMADSTNAAYPLTEMHQVNRNSLLTQVGSTNELYDNENRYRTFLGNMDELRIWNTALDSASIRCQYKESLRGDEQGLILYYRFNDRTNTSVLCDAAGNAHWGRMRNGIDLVENDRPIAQTYTVFPTAIDDSLNCTADTTFTFRFSDTSFCGTDVNLSIVGPDAGLFELSRTSLRLVQGVPQTVGVTLEAQITGTIQATLLVRGANRCGPSYNIPFNIVRTTELLYSQPRIELDTLYVDCMETTVSTDTLEICNSTNRSISISNITVGDPSNFSWRPVSGAPGFPRALAPGECWTILVSMNAADTTLTRYDTLRVESTDRCPGSGIIPIQGHTQDALVLLNAGGGGRLDRGSTIDFGRVCPNQISDVRLYQYRNFASDTAFIDSIYFGTNQFFTRRRAFPITLPPVFAFRPDFMRFRPTTAGTINDTLFVKGRIKGCTIIKKFAVTGYGYDVDNGFDTPNLSYGAVTVGKTQTMTSNAFNNGDPARFTAYLKIGDAFRITSAKSFQMGTGQQRNVSVEFRPREAKTYYDTLCIFDQQCYGTSCIPISGTGVFDALEFVPSSVRLENVVGCQCDEDTVTVENVTGSPLTILDQPASQLIDPSGKISIVGDFPTGSISPGEKFEYVVRYCPNDLDQDRSDIGYIHLELDDGQEYEIVVRTSSVVPRLFVEPLTAYGVVEAGWNRTERILIENISTVPIDVAPNGISVPPGYTILGTTPAIPTTLNPRDSLWVDVDFRPQAETQYNGDITVRTTAPCQINFTGSVEGTGKVVRLDVPVTFLNFGLNKPCDCTEREIPLPNNSEYIPMTIDSIWIDGGGLNNANPAYFSWYSKQTGSSATPYIVPPQTTDTLIIRFCPSGPSDTSQVVHNAKIHIAASGTSPQSGAEIWAEEFATTISGRREIFYVSNRWNNRVGFGRPATVGTTVNRNVWITVPDEFLNPSGDSIIITGVSFEPDDRVFGASANSGDPLPWVVKRGESFRIDLTFSPRAPKRYTAKMVLHMSYPCSNIDSTIELVGNGYATNRGWEVAIDTAGPRVDTFHISNCDTLVIPVQAYREMPPEQEVIDLLFRAAYDTASLTPIDVLSPYSTQTQIVDTGTGAWVRINDAWNVSEGDFAYVRFLAKGLPNQFELRLDNFDYDSDSLVEYRYITEGDRAWIIIDQPLVQVDGLTDFDTVLVKDCEDQQVTVWNPGVLPVTFDSLALPKDHSITASSIPIPAVLQPGDTIELTVTYCPTEEAYYDSTFGAWASAPCDINDTARLRSIGYAPPWPITLEIEEDPIAGMIADTISVNLTSDRYMPVAPVDVAFQLRYNRRSLQFLDIESPYLSTVNAEEQPYGLDITIDGVDSLLADTLATLKFAFAVPDEVMSEMRIDEQSIGFDSDSIFFVKPIPTGDTSTVQVDPRCNITRLVFRDGLANKMSVPAPNPARTTVSVEIESFEDVPARLVLYNIAGEEVMTLLPGTEILAGGRYAIEFDVSDLATGIYFLRFETRDWSTVESLHIRR